MLQLMDTYAASWSVFLFAILESVLIGWVYGKYMLCSKLLSVFISNRKIVNNYTATCLQKVQVLRCSHIM